MADLLFVAIMVAFFVLAAGFVAACDRIISPGGTEAEGEPAVQPEPEPARKTAA